MRLKFLFFPVMLIISISIFFGYVWPEINTARETNQEYLKDQDLLRQASEKESAFGSVSEKIKQDPDVIQTVVGYLPQKRSEEQIVNNINFLATSLNITLANIGLADSSLNATNQQSPLNTDAGIVATSSTAVNAQTNKNTPSSINQESNVRYTEATITVSGSYEKLSSFFDQLQHSGMYNKVKSLTISINKSTDAGTKTTDASGKVIDVKTNNSQLLTAIGVVNFGYLSPVKFDNKMASTFQPSFSSDSIQFLKKYVAQKSQGINIGEAGKPNPFQ